MTILRDHYPLPIQHHAQDPLRSIFTSQYAISFAGQCPNQNQSLCERFESTGRSVARQMGGEPYLCRQPRRPVFAQGYCAAKDRLFQFEIWRRQATGTVAEILGERELKRDIGTRLFQFRGDLKKELNHYHPQGEAIINAYVAGVNSYIAEALQDPNKLPIEFKLLKILPGKWTPAVVISRHQGLLGNVPIELNTGMAVAKIGDAKVKELMWYHPKEPNYN